MEIVSHVDAGGQPLVSLTFDDGPSIHTVPIVELLGRHGGRATFFVQGSSVAGHEDALRAAAVAGHEHGVHTWSHTPPPGLEDDALADELRRTRDLVEEVTGARPRLLRPPYGRDAERYARTGAGLGLGPTVLWTIDGYDYTDATADDIVRFVLGPLRPGAVVVLHDGRRAEHPTIHALGIVLGELDARGYRSVTVSELLAAAGAA